MLNELNGPFLFVSIRDGRKKEERGRSQRVAEQKEAVDRPASDKQTSLPAVFFPLISSRKQPRFKTDAYFIGEETRDRFNRASQRLGNSSPEPLSLSLSLHLSTRPQVRLG